MELFDAPIITPGLVEWLKANFALAWHGTHGAPHWQRVWLFGKRLTPLTGADIRIVQYFSVLHDCCRLNEGSDPQHGARAADLLPDIRAQFIALDDVAFEKLCFAVAWHNHGKTDNDASIGTCWDADRLDLGRVGMRCQNHLLSTAAAKDVELQRWAWGLSSKG